MIMADRDQYLWLEVVMRQTVLTRYPEGSVQLSNMVQICRESNNAGQILVQE